MDETKLGCDIFQQLYQRVHGSEVELHWKEKKELDMKQLKEVNWEAISKARKKGTLTRQIFIAKHVTGMCGVGEFMKLLKERDSDECPRCRLQEDTRYVWKHQNQESIDVWNASLEKPNSWMCRIVTDPDLRKGILLYLNHWRNGED
jgi:hypothetical protein